MLEEAEVPGQISMGMLTHSHQRRVQIPDTQLADLKYIKMVSVTG